MLQFNNLLINRFHQPANPPLLTPPEMQQIVFIRKNAYVSAVPNPLFPFFRVSVMFDCMEFFGNGKTLIEAKDNVILAVVDYLTKKQSAVQIPKAYTLGTPWQIKVRGECPHFTSDDSKFFQKTFFLFRHFQIHSRSRHLRRYSSYRFNVPTSRHQILSLRRRSSNQSGSTDYQNSRVNSALRFVQDL